MRRAVSFVTLMTFALVGCGPGHLKPISDAEEHRDAAEIERALMAFRPHERIEVLITSGECFEAEFHSFEGVTLSLGQKWYGQAHHRGEGLRGDRLEYLLDEIAGVATVSEARATPVKLALGATLFALIAGVAVLAAGWSGEGLSSISLQ